MRELSTRAAYQKSDILEAQINHLTNNIMATETLRQAQFPGINGLTQEMTEYLAAQGIESEEKVGKFLVLWERTPDETLDAAIGSFLTLESGAGQERNEPFDAAAKLADQS